MPCKSSRKLPPSSLHFTGEKDLSYAWAVYLLVHMFFTQILHTISIGLTVTLAVWRYVAIR